MNLALVFAVLAAALTLLSLHFYDWPPNRDLTTYATIARELRFGKWLYIDVWDIKPPAVFVVYGLAQSLIESQPLQLFMLRLLPSLLVLAALVRAGRDAGFGDGAGALSGLFWLVLSGNVRFQMHEPNTELFINACVAWAFLAVLRLRAGSGAAGPLAVGLLLALATLFKTVSLAIAAIIGIAHLLFPPLGAGRAQAARQLARMAASGVVVLSAVVLYFAATGRFEAFREVMVDAGGEYAGNVWANILRALTLAPIIGVPARLGLTIVLGLWLGITLLAWLDRERRRAWALLGGYAFSALVAAGLPGKFYAHYAQLLVPPLCLGLGWLAPLLAGSSSRPLRLAPPALLGILLVLLAVRGSRDYLVTPEERLSGRPSEIYLETQKLGRRLGQALAPDEVLYQIGEETGLYWFSGKRPTAAIGVVQLVQWPQAARLLEATVGALQARPPALIVVANRLHEQARGHPVFAWIDANYRAVEPADPGERKFFTFYLSRDPGPELVRRVLFGGIKTAPGGWPSLAGEE